MNVRGADNGNQSLSHHKKRVSKWKKLTASRFFEKKPPETKEPFKPNLLVKGIDKSVDEKSRNKLFNQFQKALRYSSEPKIDSVISAFQAGSIETKLFFLKQYPELSLDLLESLPKDEMLEVMQRVPLEQIFSYVVKKSKDDSSDDIIIGLERRMSYSKEESVRSFEQISKGKSQLFNRFSFEIQFFLFSRTCSGIKKQFWDSFRFYSRNHPEIVIKILARSIGSVPHEFTLQCIEKLPGKQKIALLSLLNLETFKQIGNGYIPLFDKLVSHPKLIGWLRECISPDISGIFEYIETNTSRNETKELFQKNTERCSQILDNGLKWPAKEIWEKPDFFGIQSIVQRSLQLENETFVLQLLRNHGKYAILLRGDLSLAAPDGQLRAFCKREIEKKMADDLIKLIDNDSRKTLYAQMMSIVFTYSKFTSTEMLFKRIHKKFFSTKTPPYLKRNLYGLVSKIIRYRDVHEIPGFIHELLEFKPEETHKSVIAAKTTLLRAVSRRKKLLNYFSDGGSPRTPSPRQDRLSRLDVLKRFTTGMDCSEQIDTLVKDIKNYTLQFIHEISHEEFVDMKWLSESAGSSNSNVKAAIDEFDKLSNYIKDHIVDPELEYRERASRIEFFIELCSRLVEAGDFFSPLAFYAALNSKEITILKKSWELVKPEYKESLKVLDDLFSLSDNYGRLRRRVAEFEKKKVPYCFCYVYLKKDLVAIKTQDKWDGNHINYAKVGALAKVFMEFHRCKILIPHKEKFRTYSDFQTSMNSLPTRDYGRLSVECL